MCIPVLLVPRALYEEVQRYCFRTQGLGKAGLRVSVAWEAPSPHLAAMLASSYNIYLVCVVLSVCSSAPKMYPFPMIVDAPPQGTGH